MAKGFTFLGSEFRINPALLTGNDPSVTSLANGGYVVTWTAADSAYSGVFAQRFDAGGTAKGAAFQVNTTSDGVQGGSSVTGLSGGRFVVTWRSEQPGGVILDVYAQVYSANGVKIGTEVLVNTETTGVQRYTEITGLEGGGFVVSWASLNQDGDDYGIYAQIFSPNGTPRGDEFLVNTETANDQNHPDITGLKGGGFVVTWDSWLQDSGTAGIFGQAYTANGAKVGLEYLISSAPSYHQFAPSVTALEDGGYVVTWQSRYQDGSEDGIFGQKYDASGAKAGGEFSVNSHTPGDQSVSDVVGLADGGFVVVWQATGQDSGLNASTGIYGQRFDANGVEIGGEFHVSTHEEWAQNKPSIAALENGGFVVTWTSQLQDGTSSGIYGQQFAARLFGTSSADTVTDDVGAHWLNGQAGNDVLKGLGGNDKMFGGFGNDRLFGGSGRDTLNGNDGNDKLFGGAGKDELLGGDKRDRLDGGADSDKLTGGSGQDEFIFKLGYDRDRITDFQDDVDTLVFDKNLWGSGLNKQQVIDTFASVDGGDIVFDFGADELRLKGFTDLTELKDDMAFI